MPVEKFGITDRSAKLAWPPLITILLMDIGMPGAAFDADAATAGARPAGARFLPPRGSGGAGGAGPAGARFLPARGSGAAGAGAAVAATGGPVVPLGAVTVAPGPANTRFTLMDSSGSIITRAYSLRAVT